MQKASSPKRILMTGCGSGFGKTMRIELLKAGHFVSSIGNHESDNYQANFALHSWDSLNDLMDEIDRDNAGQWFDALINNAGAMHLNFIEDYTEEQFGDAISVNLTAPLALMKHFIDRCEGLRQSLPERIPVGGWRIINTVSMAVKSPPRACIGYVAAKAGLEAATRALARELAPKPYILSCIAPCAVDRTGMQLQGWNHLIDDRNMSPSSATLYQSNNPMKRLAEHDEIFKVFKFAIEEMPAIMSGTTLYIPAASGV